ncbi:type I pullulanase [Bacteroides graminisolvens]
MKQVSFLMTVVLVMFLISCTPTRKKEYASFDEYPVPNGDLTEMEYTAHSTTFSLWAPTADEVRLMLFDSGHEGHAYQTVPMEPIDDGTWKATVEKNLLGKFYTFNVKINDKWQGDTPGINAKAVGINGKRAAIIDMRMTDPEGWNTEVKPAFKSPADVVIYEMHHRDLSVHFSSGIKNKGKFIALTERGTKTPDSLSTTGLDHLIDLGITHVHLLPSFDYASIDESKLKDKKYNWGYDPLNYNVPEGSYATDPFTPSSRIREFKKMVMALHKAGICVIMDVVYNHVNDLESSNFERTAPGYFFRKKKDGSWANGSACGNETASERPMMRKYMIESVLYWMKEYHVDGFRFDLMGIHDIETMNEIRNAVNAVDPSIIIYGEGWAAEAPQLPADSLAMKANTQRMPGIAAFSDEMRDGLRGPFNNNHKGAFLAGIPGGEQSIKFGIVGAVKHPQVYLDSVNYTKIAWAGEPTQMISYVSCHDDMCLVDRLQASVPGITPKQLVLLDKLAQTAVFTSQGIPFIYAGEEIMRDKKGVHNSFESPDSINAIDWRLKALHADVFAYYKGLIALRKAHPAFRMAKAEMVRKHLEFLPVDGSNVIAFRVKGHANGDACQDLIVILNARTQMTKVTVPAAKYTVFCKDGFVSVDGSLGTLYGPEVYVAPQTALIMGSY